MMYTGRLLDEKYGEIKMLTPLSFTCEVKGVELTATVIAMIDHPADFIYRIRFSDGYQSDFTPSQNGRWYDIANEKEYRLLNKSLYVSYADSIQNDLRDLRLFEIFEEAYCFRIPVQGAMTNVYELKESEEQGGHYRARFGGCYQFSRKRVKNARSAGSKYDPKASVDGELARNISLLIEAHQ